MATVKITQTDEGVIVERVGSGNNDNDNDNDDKNKEEATD